MAKKRKDGYMTKTFTVDGKRYFVYGKNAKELFEKEKEKREEIEKGYELRNNPTLAQYYDIWECGRQGSVAEATMRGQRKEFNVISGIFIPSASRTFGELKIKDIKKEDLQRVQKELLKERKTRTVNDYMALVNHVMKDAMKERIIDYNPCVLLNKLKIVEEKARDTHHRALSIEEQKAFFECDRCKSSFYYNVFRIAILTGMRVGEIGALKNTDIRAGEIHIERTITRTEAGNYIIGDSAKTEAGRRTIPINNTIQEVLDNQKELNSLLDGNVLAIDDTVFKAVERGLLVATPIDREIKRICKVCGIEPFTMHALRSTFATRCIEAGMNPRTLQELLGHSNFNITMSLYGHVLKDTKTKAMNNLHIAI